LVAPSVGAGGHDELVGERTRCCLIDRERLGTLLGPGLPEDFDQACRCQIAEAIATRRLAREPSKSYGDTGKGIED